MNKNDIKEDRHCFSCGKTFKKPFELVRHKNRKTPCLIQEIPENDNAVCRCKFCNRAYKHERNLLRHYNTCKIKNGGMEILMHKVGKEEELEQKKMMNQMLTMMKTQQTMIKNMEKKIDDQATELKELKDMKSASIQGNNNTIDNSIKNITINNYLTPNVEGLILDKSTIDNYSNLSYAVLDQIYFNPERPENHSFYVSNKKEKELMVYTICNTDELQMKWKMLTTDKDRELFVKSLQNIIIKEGGKVVNGMYDNNTEAFAALPKDLRERIIEFNGGERLKEKEVLQIAFKGGKKNN